MTHHARRLLAPLLLCLVLIASGCGDGGQDAGEGRNRVRIAAASDLQAALKEIITEYAADHPDVQVTATYGSSGTFYSQLTNGAPFDLYLSADLSYANQLVDAGKADADDVFGYAVGRLVLWAPNDSPVDVTQGLAGLEGSDLRALSIANPEHAPYGVAAVDALKSAGVYDTVQDKLVLGESVAQAAEFTSSGNAEAGIIALSLALTPELQDRGTYLEIPLDSYDTIDQGGVVMGDAGDPEAARSFRDFLLSDQGITVLKRYGFYLPAS